MPTIKQYDAPEGLGLRPTETGINAVAGAARRVQGEYNEAAAAIEGTGQRANSAIRDAGDVAVKYEDHRQISAGAMHGAQLINTLNDSWNKTIKDPNLDPNDPAVAAKWRDQSLEPALDQFKEGFTTERSQQWAEHFVDQYREHAFHKTSADMSALAGQAAVLNHTQTVNALSNTVMNDPSSLEFALKAQEGAARSSWESSPNTQGPVPASLIQDGAQKIVKAAAVGQISQTGEVPAWTSEPRYSKYINGTELAQFAKQAQAQKKADLYYQKATEQYQKAQSAEAAHAGLSRIWTDNVSFDENGKATINPQYFKSVMEIEKQFPGAATERARTMINWAQAQQKERRETIVTDKAAYSAALEGMLRTDSPTTGTDLLKLASEHKIDQHDLSIGMQLYKELQEAPLKGPIWQSTMQGAKEAVGADIVGDGHERYASFMQSFIPEYLRQQRAGSLPPNALDLKNPASLISQSLDKWRATPQEKMLGRALKNIGGVMPEGAPPLPAPAAKPAVLPPVEKREAGKVYLTARGNMKWTGTGWVSP